MISAKQMNVQTPLTCSNYNQYHKETRLSDIQHSIAIYFCLSSQRRRLTIALDYHKFPLLCGNEYNFSHYWKLHYNMGLLCFCVVVMYGNPQDVFQGRAKLDALTTLFIFGAPKSQTTGFASVFLTFQNHLEAKENCKLGRKF